MSKYAIISGNTPSDIRDKIIKIFNSKENARGEIIKVLLVSKTGAEGLDLKNIRETHQIEPYWDKSRDEQFIARAVRVGSHDELPEKDRDVQPYLYISTANKEIWELMSKKDREEQSIDEMFHKRALEKHKLNTEFRTLLTEVSIECQLFGYKNCRVCAPTNQPLYRGDVILDAKLPDPCETIIETESTAIEIEYDGTKYYYIKNNDKLSFYEYRNDLGGYSPIDPASPLIIELEKKIILL